MPQTEAERKASLKYRKAKRKQIVLEMGIDEFEAISQYCADKGINKATWIKGLIKEAMADKAAEQ